MEETEEGFGMALGLWTFAAPFTMLAWTLVDGQHISCSPHIIHTRPGQDVVLLCHVEPKLSVTEETIEWSRPINRIIQGEYVHLYRNQNDIPHGKMQSYVGRTSLSTDLLTEGIISLKIRNVTLEDQGTYRCLIPNLKGGPREGFVILVVDPNIGTTTETPLDPGTPDSIDVKDEGGHHHVILVPLLVFCLVVALGVGVFDFLLFTKAQRKLADLKETDYVAVNSNPSPA